MHDVRVFGGQPTRSTTLIEEEKFASSKIGEESIDFLLYRIRNSVFVEFGMEIRILVC